jgi:hypothetical protein
MTLRLHAPFTVRHRSPLDPRRPMAESPLRVCPTRSDGTPALVAHKVDPARCQERQRQHYHKCFTCAWNNAHVARFGEPVAPGASSEAGSVEPASAAS